MARNAYPDPYPQYASLGDLSGVTPGAGAARPAIHAPHFKPAAATMHSVALFANNLTTTAEIADRLDAVPYIPGYDLTIDQASIEVTTAVASAQARIGFYSHNDATGYPGDLLASSGALDCSTTGEKTWTVSRTFTAGLPTWIVLHYSSTATFRAASLSQLVPLSATTTQAMQCVVNGGAPFAGGLPTPFPTPGLASRNVPLVKLRAT